MNPRIICEADKAARTITFYVREGFGDGRDFRGLCLADPEQERAVAMRTFGEAIDVITGKKRSAVAVEKWCTMTYLDDGSPTDGSLARE
jgi:hypothetical protein